MLQYMTFPYIEKSDLSRFHLSYHTFGKSVYAVGVVFLGKAGTKEGGKSLIEACTNRTKKSLYQLIGR